MRGSSCWLRWLAALLGALHPRRAVPISLRTSQSDLEAAASPSGNIGKAAPIRIRAYFVNVDGSMERGNCMWSQLEKISQSIASQNVELHLERFPAVSFTSCHDVESCKAERPECFPTGAGFAGHGKMYTKEDKAVMVRGVFGNWCSHLKAVQRMTKVMNHYDYFLLFEDDLIFKDGFLPAVVNLTREMEPHWSLIAVDTFNLPKRPFPEHDRINPGAEPPLYSISSSMGTYWGAHAWVVNTAQALRLANFLEGLPAMPVDWVPKVARPPHVGMWAFQPGMVEQRMMEADTSQLPEECQKISLSVIAGHPVASLQLSQHASSFMAADTQTETPAREVIIFGLLHSGADIMKTLIEEVLEKPYNTSLCRDGAGQSSCGRVWAFTHPSRWNELESLRTPTQSPLKEAVAVVVVRHPFGFIREMHSRKRQGMHCSSKLWGPCSTASRNSTEISLHKAECMPMDKEGAAVYLDDRCWSSVPEAWGSHVEWSSYQAKQGIFHRTLFVRYEDIVEYPDHVLDRIAKAADMRLPWHAHQADAQRGEFRSHARDVVAVHEQQMPHAPRDVGVGDTPLDDEELEKTIENRLDEELARMGQKVLAGNSTLAPGTLAEELRAWDFAQGLSCEAEMQVCRELPLPVLYRFGYHACQQAYPEYTEKAYGLAASSGAVRGWIRCSKFHGST